MPGKKNESEKKTSTSKAKTSTTAKKASKPQANNSSTVKETSTSKTRAGTQAAASHRKLVTWIIVCALILVIGAGAAVGAWLIWGNKTDPTPTLRYESVRVDEIRAAATNTAANISAAKSFDDKDLPYYLVGSYYDNNTFYYMFYLGYIKSVPIVSGQPVRYDKTPINITYTKTTELSSAITNSLSTSSEYSTTKHQEVNFGISGTLGYKGPLGGSGSLTLSAGGLFSWEQTSSRSTTSTVERTESVMHGESFAISATIGENNESPGVYRYALFGTTDVYYVLELNKSDRTYKEATTVHCARGDIAWGIDYAPDGVFGKTSDSKNLVIPDDIDYKELPTPEEELDKAPVLEPGYSYKTFKVETGWIYSTTANASVSVSEGDADIADTKEKTTSYEFEVKIDPVNDGKRDFELTFIFTVKEGDASTFDSSVLVMTYKKRIDLGLNSGFVALANDKQWVEGTDPPNTACNERTYITHVYYSAPKPKEDIIKKLVVILDGPGNDNDADGIAFEAIIEFDYLSYSAN